MGGRRYSRAVIVAARRAGQLANALLLLPHGSTAHDAVGVKFCPLRRYRQSIAENSLGFLQDAAQMIRSSEALYIDLVDIPGLEWI